ncbi:MAG: hypothetical protein L0210_00150 [Rhodospirillales bacterium]|nr:hypothetical protein [Rhodospirillales bacterium]
MSRLAALLRAAAIALTACASSETADNCLYIVKYEGKALKWHSCEEPPAMVSKRMTKR